MSKDATKYSQSIHVSGLGALSDLSPFLALR